MSTEQTKTIARNSVTAIEKIHAWLDEYRPGFQELQAHCTNALEREKCGVPRAVLPTLLARLQSEAGWSEKDCVRLLRESGFTPLQRQQLLEV
ncbi:MAG TPA: hypothetical protein VKP88_04185 [Candidatus Paceibacterota bacterium]|nr:hypothetical protein [Candidatus Paceibacterota bacterium]